MNTQKELFGKLPTPIKNPFEAKNIYYINMSALYLSESKRWTIEGRVDFKNGNTEGTQSFSADTMDGLYIKIQEFINSME